MMLALPSHLVILRRLAELKAIECAVAERTKMLHQLLEEIRTEHERQTDYDNEA